MPNPPKNQGWEGIADSGSWVEGGRQGSEALFSPSTERCPEKGSWAGDERSGTRVLGDLI